MPDLVIHLPDELYQRLLSTAPPMNVDGICASALEEALNRRMGVVKERKKPGPKADVKKDSIGAYLELDLIDWLKGQMRGPKDMSAVLSSIIRQAKAIGLKAFPDDP